MIAKVKTIFHFKTKTNQVLFCHGFNGVWKNCEVWRCQKGNQKPYIGKMIDGKMKKKNPHPTSSPYLVYATNNVFSVYNCIEYTSGGLISKRQILLKFSSKWPLRTQLQIYGNHIRWECLCIYGTCSPVSTN
jgi:hypothetical protein